MATDDLSSLSSSHIYCCCNGDSVWLPEWKLPNFNYICKVTLQHTKSQELWLFPRQICGIKTKKSRTAHQHGDESVWPFLWHLSQGSTYIMSVNTWADSSSYYLHFSLLCNLCVYSASEFVHWESQIFLFHITSNSFQSNFYSSGVSYTYTLPCQVVQPMKNLGHP